MTILQGAMPWLAGILLIVCGLLSWVQPSQRMFFGVITVLAALGSFVTSNLGGFLLGMLLGLVGGGLIVAWTPGHAKGKKQPAEILPGLVERQLEA
ncbi:hypothetical protein GCM10010468_64390 [Actinocorallia longicatena]|uniref:Uncharacterized protein n=1 Tax=Actinocorallia longicatena TaxID=111803 RepID=A0ABP6QI38_9ACTN